MKTIEQPAIWHYVVVRYSNGSFFYEGCHTEEEARKRATTSVAGATAEYTGTSLPAEVVEWEQQRDIELTEDYLRMRQPLSGSDKQIAWARAIRARYGHYLQERCSNVYAARERYATEMQAEPQRVQANWWIQNRYALGITTQASRYIAEGR